MIETILQLFLVGLSIWEHKEKTKYIDQVVKLRAKYYAENNKPAGSRNDALLDSIRFELLNLADAFASEVASSKTTA